MPEQPQSNPEFHELRRGLEYFKQERGSDSGEIGPNVIRKASELLENTFLKLQKAQEASPTAVPPEITQMKSLIEKYAHEEVVGEFRDVRYRNPEKVKEEMIVIIERFLENHAPEGFQQYDKLKTPEEKKAFIRQNMESRPELKDPYFSYELLRDFGKDTEFAAFVIEHMETEGLPSDISFNIFMELSNFSKETAVLYANRFPNLKKIIEFSQKYSQIFENTNFYRVAEMLANLGEDTAAFDTVLRKIEALPADRQQLFISVLREDYVYPEELFKTNADINLYFEIQSLCKGRIGYRLRDATEAFNALYEYGPDPNGSKDQAEAAKRLSAVMLVGMLSCARQIRLPNCSHRELTSALIQKNPSEIMSAIANLDPRHRRNFFMEMIDRKRLTDIFSVLPDDMKEEFTNIIVESVETSTEDLLASTGLEALVQNPVMGPPFLKMLIGKYEALGEQGKAMKNFLLVKFEKEAREYNINFNADEFQNMKEKIDGVTKYDAAKALQDKTYKVVTCFTTDLKVRSNSQKDLWMQNSDFLRTYKALIAKGYQLEKTVDKNGNRAKGPINTPEEADKLGTATLTKTINGIKIVQELVKTQEDFLGMKAAFEDASVDMIVQRGHCWDAEESFNGYAEKASQSKPHQSTHSKIVIIGGCFQARNLPEFGQRVEGGKNLFFVATTKTGKGEITIPLTIVYAEEVVKAGVKTGGVVDMSEIDKSIQQRLTDLLRKTPEADGYIFTTDVSQVLPKITGLAPEERPQGISQITEEPS